jgi:hypothetical protein
VKQIHIIPDDDSEDEHTTSDCQCGPAEITLDGEDGYKEWIVFHWTDADYPYLYFCAEDEDE